MIQTVKSFVYDESGLGTIELVVLILVLIGLAFLFREKIKTFLSNLLSKFNETTVFNNFDPFSK